MKAVIRLKQLAGKPIKFDFVGDENGEVRKAIKEGLPLWRPWKDDKKSSH